MIRAGVLENTLFFELEGGRNISCVCIKDEFAKEIADSITAMIERLARVQADLDEYRQNDRDQIL